MKSALRSLTLTIRQDRRWLAPLPWPGRWSLDQAQAIWGVTRETASRRINLMMASGVIKRKDRAVYTSRRFSV